MSSISVAAMSSSSAAAGASDRDAELGLLSGPALVAHLRATCRRADYDAVARVLDARDRRLASAEAQLAEFAPRLADAEARLETLREDYLALDAARRRAPIGRPSRGAAAAAAPVVDLCDSCDEGDWEEREFRRPDVAAGASRKGKEPTPPEGGEGRRAGGSWKSNARAFIDSSDDDVDEDDRIPLKALSELMKKRREAQPVPNGDHPPERPPPPVNRGGPKATSVKRKRRLCKSGVGGGLSRAMPTPLSTDSAAGSSHHQLEVATFVQGKGMVCQSGVGQGLSRAMPTPSLTDSAVGNENNSSKAADGDEDGARIGAKQGSAAGLPFPVRTPSHKNTVRRSVESARAGAETPKERTGFAPDATITLVLNTISDQEKTNGGMHKMKAPLETNESGEKTHMVLGDTREQTKTQGQVLKIDVLPGTNNHCIGQQSGKLSTRQNREVSDGGRFRMSDKPVSASLQPNKQLTLHSEQTPAESSLPTSLEPNNQITLHSEQMPVESSLPSAVASHWESAWDVYASCLNSKELCMQAACALHRQRKLTIQGGQSGYTGLSKFDLHRYVEIEFPRG
ncbi:hypothetical protein BAE44_0002114 [Dichanthelium oligosanthes]|uniref:Uncharacterized protein n=1 Tax=Dichanthelium oligosanthes TaxID=888268 RepID=A0A1E5WHI8_9POAL|nr:hypothetical protein BAE44_0002114 [Dichanthelium oligosanthes]